MCVRILCMFGDAPLNTQSFRCFQIIHAPKIIRELIPFLKTVGASFSILIHQSSNEVSAAWGARTESPTLLSIWNHTCLAKTQPMRMCWMSSSTWSQSALQVGWGSHLLASLSAVQQRLWTTNQIKNWHFLGAQLFQMSSHGSKCTAPMKKVS